MAQDPKHLFGDDPTEGDHLLLAGSYRPDGQVKSNFWKNGGHTVLFVRHA